MKNILFCCLVLTACTIPQQTPDLYTDSTIGKIIQIESSTSYEQNHSTMIPVDGMFLAFQRKETVHTYIYTISTSNGPIRTKSSQSFAEDDCVILWHPEMAQSKDDRYNFVSGILERADKCE